MADFDFRFHAIPEPQLVPYQALRELPVRSLLVLAPHPDDEVIGCGGLLALAAGQGVEARVLILSDGAAGGDASAREIESRRAARALGLADTEPALGFWRLPDRGVRPDGALVRRLQTLIDAQTPQWVLAPSPFEIHPDHRAVCLAAIAAMQGREGLGFYEVGQPLLPNRLVDITTVVARKVAAMACFPSQLAVQRYDEQVLALNRYRAYTLGPAVTHAEALWFPTPEECRDATAVQRALAARLAERLGVDGR